MNLSPVAVSSDDVAGEVRAWMGRRQRSTRSVALELGWTETYLGRRLNGSISFNVAELGRLAELLEVPVSAFFELPPGIRKRGINPPAQDRWSGTAGLAVAA